MLPHCCKDPKSSGMNSRPTQDPTSMKTDHEKDARKNALHGDNAGLTPDLMAPWDPYFLEPPAQSDLDLDSHTDLVIEWMNKKEALLRTYGDTAIMYPDITPKEVNNNFCTIIDVLLPILEKDSPRRFLSFFEKYGGWIVWRSRIIPEALNCLITENVPKLSWRATLLSYIALEALSLSPELLDSDKSRDKNSAPVQNDNLHLYGRIQQQVNHQPRRSLSTAAAMLKLCMSRKVPGK